jgi:hypothetical protein
MFSFPDLFIKLYWASAGGGCGEGVGGGRLTFVPLYSPQKMTGKYDMKGVGYLLSNPSLDSSCRMRTFILEKGEKIFRVIHCCLLLLADSLCFLSSLILFNENGRD